MDIIKTLTNLIKKTMENPKLEAYCMRCKTKREMTNPETVITKNKRNAAKGKCSICGTNMFKILGINKDNPTTVPSIHDTTPSSEAPSTEQTPQSTTSPTQSVTSPTVENEMDSFDEANK